MRRQLTFLFKNVFHSQQTQIFNTLKKKSISCLVENQQYQLQKLGKVLAIAGSEIEYYKHLKSIDFCNINYLDFLKLPVLTKDIIRADIDKLLNRRFQDIGSVFKNTSGGSTGEPVTFFKTKEQGFHGVANYYYANYLNDVDIYDRSLDLWGAERDMHNRQTGFNLKAILSNKTTLNTFVLSDEIVESYIGVMNINRPKFIKAYVHSIYDISKYINKHGIKINFKPVIHCTTGPLYPEMKNEIRRAFNDAHVYNFYGSREVSAIATEVANHKGLHVLFDNVFVEILNENNEPVKRGEEGEVVVTTLNNFYMPLVRYKIGDRAIKGDDLNFGTLILDNVLGRTLGVIHCVDGRKIDGQFFTTLFFNKKGIKSFQLIQRSLQYIQLYIVKTEHFVQQELEVILERIRKELPSTLIDVVFTETINLTSTGKIMYVFSDINR